MTYCYIFISLWKVNNIELGLTCLYVHYNKLYTNCDIVIDCITFT